MSIYTETSSSRPNVTTRTCLQILKYSVQQHTPLMKTITRDTSKTKWH